MKICIVTSNYYPKISKMLINGALDKLKKRKIKNYKIINVPGTYEIPVIISNFIHKYDAVVALGCIIKGQTSHFNFLCSSVFNALTDISVKSKVPIGNGILTCENKKQAIKRADPKKKDKGCKAVEAVLSAYEVINK